MLDHLYLGWWRQFHHLPAVVQALTPQQIPTLRTVRQRMPPRCASVPRACARCCGQRRVSCVARAPRLLLALRLDERRCTWPCLSCSSNARMRSPATPTPSSTAPPAPGLAASNWRSSAFSARSRSTSCSRFTARLCHTLSRVTLNSYSKNALPQSLGDYYHHSSLVKIYFHHNASQCGK